MIQLANSDKLAIRYSAYIQELQEFFALHDVLCGAPRELGFFAARLSGRDTFPAELASMVRSFIFREGGSIPLDDLRTVVALAVGGPAVAKSADELQHPLHDLSTFLANVASSPLDELPPTPFTGEATQRSATVPLAAAPPVQASIDTAEPVHSEDPFRPPLTSSAALAPANVPVPLAASSQQLNPTSFPKPARNRRPLWAALAIGLPLALLFAFLYHPPTQTTQSPGASAAPSGPPPPASLSAPHAVASTPLSNAAAALARPTPVSPMHPAVSSPSTITRFSAPSPGPLASSPTPPRAGASSQFPSASSATSSTPSANAAGSTATVSPAPAPPTASSASLIASSPAPHPAPPRTTPATTSVASVTAQQGAFGVSSGIMSSHLISFSPPKYPKMAGFTHAEGQVILQAVVSKTGKVSAVKAITGPRTLRKAAETSVRQWRYRPYITDGRAADVATIITIDVKAPH